MNDLQKKKETGCFSHITHTHTQVNYKQIKDVDVKDKIFKFLEANIRVFFLRERISSTSCKMHCSSNESIFKKPQTRRKSLQGICIKNNLKKTVTSEKETD